MKLRQNWKGAKIQEFQGTLLGWFGAHQRALPWRRNPTPYRVWVSEVMLQQTQAKTVVPYYERFLKRFPDIKSLARASQQKVLQLWSGLGYYNRARNLHKAARKIVRQHGLFPDTYKTVLALPGVGRYTAAAICSLAFNQAQPVVDGNVRRVLCRLFGQHAPESHYWNWMSSLLPERESSSFNQAMMELGALVCVPFHPHCPVCPVASLCQARRLGIEESLPRARTRRDPEPVRVVALVLQQNDRICLASLDTHSLIPGNWGLPYRIASNQQSADEAASILCRRVLGRSIALTPCAQIRHSISHYRMLVFVYCGHVANPVLHPSAGFHWAQQSLDTTLLTSSLFRKILQSWERKRPQYS